MCVALAENHRTASIIRIHKEPCPLRLTPGPHYAKVPVDTSTDHVCVVCSEKHHRYKNQNPGVLFKNNPHKKSKTTIICTIHPILHSETPYGSRFLYVHPILHSETPYGSRFLYVHPILHSETPYV